MKNLNSKNAKYIASYNAWFDKLPKKQKALMKLQGLDKPHIDNYTTRQKFDVSELQIADIKSNYDETDDRKIYSRSEMRVMFSDFVEQFVHEMLRKRNIQLTAECMLLILGKSAYSSEREIADAYKMTRSNVSARCIELKDKFGLENSGYGRNLDIRLAYSKRAVGVHYPEGKN